MWSMQGVVISVCKVVWYNVAELKAHDRFNVANCVLLKKKSNCSLWVNFRFWKNLSFRLCAGFFQTNAYSMWATVLLNALSSPLAIKIMLLRRFCFYWRHWFVLIRFEYLSVFFCRQGQKKNFPEFPNLHYKRSGGVMKPI